MANDHDVSARERSLPELFSDLSSETATLVRSEMQLVRVEIAEKLKPIEKSATFLGATALFGLGAFGAVTACLIALLSLALQVWAAALIVAVVYGIAALVSVQTGRKRLAAAKPPLIPQTVATLKEDVAWTKALRKSDKT